MNGRSESVGVEVAYARAGDFLALVAQHPGAVNVDDTQLQFHVSLWDADDYVSVAASMLSYGLITGGEHTSLVYSIEAARRKSRTDGTYGQTSVIFVELAAEGRTAALLSILEQLQAFNAPRVMYALLTFTVNESNAGEFPGVIEAFCKAGFITNSKTDALRRSVQSYKRNVLKLPTEIEGQRAAIAALRAKRKARSRA